MVIGVRRFAGETLLGHARRVAEANAIAIPGIGFPDCPPSLSRLIETLRPKIPDGRIQIAEGMRDLLIAIAAATDLIPSEFVRRP